MTSEYTPGDTVSEDFKKQKKREEQEAKNAALKARLVEAERDGVRLDWLDRPLEAMRMGWVAGIAPAGNITIWNVWGGKQTIRQAIDAAIESEGK